MCGCFGAKNEKRGTEMSRNVTKMSHFELWILVRKVRNRNVTKCHEMSRKCHEM